MLSTLPWSLLCADLEWCQSLHQAGAHYLNCYKTGSGTGGANTLIFKVKTTFGITLLLLFITPVIDTPHFFLVL